MRTQSLDTKDHGLNYWCHLVDWRSQKKCSGFNGTGDTTPNQDLEENLSLCWPPIKPVGTCQQDAFLWLFRDKHQSVIIVLYNLSQILCKVYTFEKIFCPLDFQMTPCIFYSCNISRQSWLISFLKTFPQKRAKGNQLWLHGNFHMLDCTNQL